MLTYNNDTYHSGSCRMLCRQKAFLPTFHHSHDSYHMMETFFVVRVEWLCCMYGTKEAHKTDFTII